MELAERLPASRERVERATAPEVTGRIRHSTEANVARFEGSSPEAITQRLRELDREWDIERVLEANASGVILLSVLLGTAVNKKWFWLTGIAAGFLLQHAVQGWCPPLIPWRRAGVRTPAEIEEERTALKALRGDFQPTQQAEEAIAQARRE